MSPASEFHERNAERWSRALRDVLGTRPPACAEWYQIDDIISTLEHFMGSNFNHAHLPTGGGLDFQSVKSNRESECIEFEIDRKMFDIVKPGKLIINYIPESERDSFLLLELNTLNPTDIYEGTDDYGKEELVDIGSRYINRSAWDSQCIGTNYEGDEIPLPTNARLVTRWMRGKILLVAKGSLWNGDPATYDGRHSSLSAGQIRGAIERALAHS